MIPEGGAFLLAVVLTVQGLTGWEASAPLAEETKDPKRNVPLSVMLSIVIIGTFLVIVFWGVITGFGNDADAVVNSPVLPALALAHRVWGDAWFIILFAFLNSVAAVCDRLRQRRDAHVVQHGQERLVPEGPRQAAPDHKTPTNAILVQMVLNIVAGLFVGAVWGSGCRVLLRHRHRAGPGRDGRVHPGEHRRLPVLLAGAASEFNWILHFVFPVISSVVLLYACYRGFFDPVP